MGLEILPLTLSFLLTLLFIMLRFLQWKHRCLYISLYNKGLGEKMSAQVRDRALRIEILSETHKQHPDWSEERLIAEMSVVSGVRERRVMEYIALLKKAERW